MALQYRLIPPFLHVPEEDGFPDAWEAFCCKLLNLEQGTTGIIRRNPPEQGVDLFYPSKKIAYQCKSIESGKSGDFNVSHAIASYKAALKIKSTLGWVDYALCTNVAVTGTAESSLKDEIPRLLILPASHWIQLCEAKSAAVASNFRLIVDVHPRQISYGNELLDVTATFGELDPTDHDAYNVLLYCNRHDSLYRLPVHGDMPVEQLRQAITDLFRLPDSVAFSNEQISLSLTHELVVGGRRVPFSQTLTEAGIGTDSMVTYWTTIGVRDLVKDRSFRGDVIHMATAFDFAPQRSYSERRKSALKKYEAQIADRFAETDRMLTQSEE